MIYNKRGMLMETVIFIILNIAFFVLIAIFISTSSSGASVYEQAYAKQIAMIIDQAKPNTDISIDFEDALKMAKKNQVDIAEIIQINNAEKKVTVKLGKKGGYSFRYFSDYDIAPDKNAGGFVSGSIVYLKITESKT